MVHMTDDSMKLESRKTWGIFKKQNQNIRDMKNKERGSSFKYDSPTCISWWMAVLPPKQKTWREEQVEREGVTGWVSNMLSLKYSEISKESVE